MLPNEFLSQGEFTFVLSLLEHVPSAVDVRQHLAFTRQVRLLVVGAHAALQREEQHLQVALLHEPEEKTESLQTIIKIKTNKN